MALFQLVMVLVLSNRTTQEKCFIGNFLNQLFECRLPND
jgi:hypothetical protein